MLRYMTEDVISNNHVELIDNESVYIIKCKLLARSTDTMSCVASQSKQNHIDDICDTLKHARTIFLFGYGASLVIVTDLYQKLSRIGLNVRLIQETHLLM